MKEGCGWRNGMKLSLLTSHASVCNTTMIRIRVWRHRGERMLNSCVMHHHTGPTPGIMVWSGIGYNSRTPLVRIAGTLNSQRYISEVLEPVVLPYLQGLATAILQQDNARPHVARIV
ncbi:alpha-soluble NSF attachment protein [Trichonephila clavipes]|nr:alpha-soluble NSF attachment protein [Trichonephila clavipes]